MKAKISNSIFHYLISSLKLSPDYFYQEESAVLLTFRILPEVCQQMLLRIINVDEPITYADINCIDLIDSAEKKNQFLNVLFVMKIFILKDKSNNPISKPGMNDTIIINQKFKNNLRKILSSGITPINIEFKKKKKTFTESLITGIKILENFLKKVLLYESLYSSSQIDSNDIPIKDFLVHRDFLKYSNSNDKYYLTKNSIELLLNYKQNIIRNLVISYISYIFNKNDTETLNLISFIFKLYSFEIGAVFSELPEGYNTEENINHLYFFNQFGLVIIKTDKKENKPKYYITPLMKALFEDMDDLLNNVNQEESKFIFIETNFKFFAYTTNELQVKTLHYLFEVEYDFPGFIVGYITRNSIRNLLKKEIDSKIILDYLSLHAHKNTDCQCIINNEIYNINENIANQIIIWEKEKNAITAQNGILYILFISYMVV